MKRSIIAVFALAVAASAGSSGPARAESNGEGKITWFSKTSGMWQACMGEPSIYRKRGCFEATYLQKTCAEAASNGVTHEVTVQMMARSLGAGRCRGPES